MPVEITHPEPNIFLLRWRGNITIDHAAAAHNWSRAATASSKEGQYVHIIELGELRSISYNMRGWERVLRDNPDCIAVLLVNAPIMARFVALALNNLLSDVLIETCDTIDNAFVRAREIIAHEREQVS